MKLKAITSAVVTALGLGVAGSSHALPLTDTPTFQTFISGASAQDKALENLFRLNCKTGTLDIYRSGSKQRVFFCEMDGSKVPALANKKAMAFKSSEGGSGNGVQPVANGTALDFMNINALTCDAPTTVPARTVGGITLPAYQNHENCGSARVQVVPEAGISDVEPQLFGQSDLAPFGGNVFSQSGVIWGFPVSIAFRNALQEAQGLTVGAEDEANMPSLNRAQLVGLYTGSITDWSQLTDAAGTPLPSAVSAPPANSTVYVCRRVITSGTQASYEAVFLRQRCATGVPGMVTPNDGSSISTGGPVNVTSGRVNAGSGTGDVRACLSLHSDNNRWAIGMFSTENVPDDSNPGRRYRYIKMNGVAPTLKNVAEGKWDFYSENSIQWTPSLSGDDLALMQNIRDNASQPAILRVLNEDTQQPGGWRGGVMALLTKGFVPPAPPISDASIEANPVLTMTKAAAGSPNNCGLPQVFFGTPASNP